MPNILIYLYLKSSLDAEQCYSVMEMAGDSAGTSILWLLSLARESQQVETLNVSPTPENLRFPHSNLMLETALPFSTNSPILFTPLGEISFLLTLL